MEETIGLASGKSTGRKSAVSPRAAVEGERAAEVAGAARRCAAAARSPDRVSAPDPGPVRPHLRGACRGARARNAARDDRSLRSCDVLSSLRRREGRRTAPPAADRARVRLAVVRARGRGQAAGRAQGTLRRRRCGCIPAPCIGRCEQAPVAVSARIRLRATAAKVLALVAGTKTHCPVGKYIGYDEYRSKGGYRIAAECLAGQTRCRGHTQDDGGFGTARAGRRGFSRLDASGASCAASGAARDGGQYR